MVLLSFTHLFPIDGSRKPPETEEIAKEVEHIVTMYQRGFFSKEEAVEAITDMVTKAEMFAYNYARGICREIK